MSVPEFRLNSVFDALAARPAKSRGEGRALMFVAAREAEHTPSVARAAAETAPAQRVFAIDLDLQRNELARALSEGAAFGPKVDGRLGGHSFCAALDAKGAPLAGGDTRFCYHRVGRSRIYAGVFDGRGLAKSARLLILDTPDYWNAARRGGAIVIVDAPAIARSRVALRVAPHMDGVVLVVGASAGAAPAARAAKAAIEAVGGEVIGLIYAGASMPFRAKSRLSA